MTRRFSNIGSTLSSLISNYNFLVNKVGDLDNLNTIQDSSLVGALNELIANIDSNQASIINLLDLIDSGDSVAAGLQAQIDSADSIASTLQDQIDSADTKVSSEQSRLDDVDSTIQDQVTLFTGINGRIGQDNQIVTGTFDSNGGIPRIDDNGDLVNGYDVGTGPNDLLQLDSTGALPDGLISFVPDAVLEDRKADGTSGGAASSGSWQIRDLNTKARDPDSLITLSSNTFTPSVDGWIEWSAPAHYVEQHQTRLFNVTDGTAERYGTSESTDFNETGVQTRSFGSWLVEAGKTYRIEHRTRYSRGDGLGRSRSWGDSDAYEVYTIVHYWRE